MTTARVTRLLAGSPIGQTHRLLVGQTLDGWPQVQAFDANGVVVRVVPVTFTSAGAASFSGDAGKGFAGATGSANAIDVNTDNRGHAIALGLRGISPGSATVTVSCQDAEPLVYTVDVVDAATTADQNRV